MLFECVGKTLGQVLPKFPPTTDDEVDALMDTKIRVLRTDMTNYKEMPLIGTGFQHVIDSYFWNLPFASVRQCKFVMDKANIPEDEWTAKRVALAAEHNLPGAREQLTEGFKAWLQTDMFKQRRSKTVPVPKNTNPAIVDD
mmetsp:Transcript_54890/g.114865  ORF Transcript_54890/g.114865 Transcript_54890/m.114865 type:complete len:141 (-) Transcript_54890:119-541(-)